MYKFLFVLCLLIVGCSSTQTVPWTSGTSLYGFDFRDYSSQGFLFTPNEYDGEYESIGMVTVQLRPGVTKKASELNNGRSTMFLKAESGSTWLVEVIPPKDALNEAYRQARSMGADALVQFEMNTVMLDNGSLKIPGLEVSGFAIKRMR